MIWYAAMAQNTAGTTNGWSAPTRVISVDKVTSATPYSR
jgi:hypothetical protein